MCLRVGACSIKVPCILELPLTFSRIWSAYLYILVTFERLFASLPIMFMGVYVAFYIYIIYNKQYV